MNRLYGNAFRKFLLPGYESVLRGRKTLAYLDEYEKSQWLPAEALQQLAWSRLHRLVEHCWEQVPYYRKRWAEAGLAGAEDIRTPEDYARLPVLTKQDIRANFEDLHAAPRRDDMLYKATGGSTGEPLRFGYTRESYERRTAVMWRGYGWAGAWPGRRTAYLWGGSLMSASRTATAKDHVYNLLYNRRMLDCFRMNESNLDQYVADMAAAKPEIVVSYVGPLLQLARRILETGRAIHGVSSVITAAETLHHFQRPILQDAFPGAQVFNTYGCREFMLIASECEAHDGLHVNADHLHVEMLPATNEDSSRQLVLTDMSNFGMPFMRYVNGDLAVPGPSTPCSCGRSLPRIAEVSGRVLDVIRTADGRLVPGEFFPHMFKDFPGVTRFQVVQSRLDHLSVKMVADDAFTDSHEARVRAEIRRVIGDATQVELQRVPEIPLTPTGKHRVTVSELG